MKKNKSLISCILIFAMAATVILSPEYVGAAVKGPKLAKKTYSIQVGNKKTVKIKNSNAKAKVSWKLKGDVAVIKKKISKGKKASATVMGIAPGNAVLKVKYKYAKISKVLKCKITVKNKEILIPDATDIMPTQTPDINNPINQKDDLSAATATPDVKTTETPAPTSEPVEESKMESISTFLNDTDYETPSNFSRENTSSKGTIVNITYPSTVIKQGSVVNRNARVALPKDYSEDKKYPVIYVCHGIGGNENAMVDCAPILWNAVAEGKAVEAIMVFPNCCANESGTPPMAFFSVEHYNAYNNFLNDFEKCLKPYIDEHYSTLTDRDHTAICGFSMGGRVTLHLGFKLQDTFRYIDANCPAPGIFDFSDQGVSAEGLFTKSEFTLEDKYMEDTLVMIVEGTNDGVVHKFPGEYHNALTENNVPHIHYKRNGGHDAGVYMNGIYNFVRRIFKEKE